MARKTVGKITRKTKGVEIFFFFFKYRLNSYVFRAKSKFESRVWKSNKILLLENQSCRNSEGRQNKTVNCCHHKNVRHSAKIQYFELYFFANILIFIVLTDSTKKTLGYRGSFGVNFENLAFFRFLRGPNGEFPQKIQNFQKWPRMTSYNPMFSL